jgi:hydrogenase maturation protein HypF
VDESANLARRRYRVSGQVQGVGFRPFVYRLAQSMGLAGFVINDASGAMLEVQGAEGALDDFARRLAEELPPLAHIRRLRRTELPVADEPGPFEIRHSKGGEMTDAQVTVDTASCADCVREMRDPADPRYRYPFINCTNCGPRYTIIKRIPYDRPNTTMADFAMCPLCLGQYSQPADRRFHAQPIACPKCGPVVWLSDAHGKQVDCLDPIREAARLLLDRQIVAVKGLGGFHLAVRGDNEHAVARLRIRKGRDAKPFALMVADLAQARTLCGVDDAAAKLLSGVQRPIVLLPRKSGAPVADAVAPGLDSLGLMLPYTPLHHLLFAEGLPPLVMTSGNLTDEPLTKDNEDAVAHLGRIADAILLHNRRIERSVDDSVVQARAGGSTMMFRRSRGYAPQPVLTGGPTSPAILAVGSELKNVVCLYKDGRAVLSEHIGDLKDGRVYRRFIQVINDLETLFDLHPQAIAADAHPGYLSTEYAMRRSAGELAGRPALPLIRVQHHHAHIVSVLAEHGRTDEVIGLAADGVGYGNDNAVWGCEVLRVSLSDYLRLGHLRYFALPGGDLAAHETIRPALALLIDTFGSETAELEAGPFLRGTPDEVKRIIAQVDSGVNCPPSSSLGRFFDAAAAMCGVSRYNRFEGQAPIALEIIAAPGETRQYPVRLTGAAPFEIDYRPIIEAMAAEVSAGTDAATIAARFHNTVAAFLAASAVRARELTGLKIVALSGGCFANRRLSATLEAMLRQEGFEVLTHRDVPCNDGGIALGQAVVAAARLSAVQDGCTTFAKLERGE